MRTIVAGSRSILDTPLNGEKGLSEDHYYQIVCEGIAEANWTPTVVISGTARGADSLGERWARENDVPIEKFPAQWNVYGKSAGYIRNLEMAKNAEALICIYDGVSKGSKHMINIAKEQGLKIFIKRVPV